MISSYRKGEAHAVFLPICIFQAAVAADGGVANTVQMTSKWCLSSLLQIETKLLKAVE